MHGNKKELLIEKINPSMVIEKIYGGGVRKVWTSRNGDLFDITINYYKDGQIANKCWGVDGEEHRDGDKPAWISYHENGEIYCKHWYENGKSNRLGDKPAFLRYYPNGILMTKAWFINGLSHREHDKPAEISYSDNGEKIAEVWYKDGLKHRDNGMPAEIGYINGRIKHEYWYENGERLNILCANK